MASGPKGPRLETGCGTQDTAPERVHKSETRGAISRQLTTELNELMRKATRHLGLREWAEWAGVEGNETASVYYYYYDLGAVDHDTYNWKVHRLDWAAVNRG